MAINRTKSGTTLNERTTNEIVQVYAEQLQRSSLRLAKAPCDALANPTETLIYPGGGDFHLHAFLAVDVINAGNDLGLAWSQDCPYGKV